MDTLSMATVADFCEGILRQGAADAPVENIVIDSRPLIPGELFLALRGDKFDGHQFVQQCVAKGAIGVIVDRNYDWRSLSPSFAVIEVEDTLQALHKIASRYRKSLSLKVVAITGSNGKTSTKDITATLLASQYKVLKTDGNLNNHIGVPLTLLRASSHDEVAVIEIGMNHPGEIAPLAAMAAPDVGIITNIGTAHIEYMGTREAIAKEKSVLAEALLANGRAVLCEQDEYSSYIKSRCIASVTTVGLRVGDIQATGLRAGDFGTRFDLVEGISTAVVELPLLGEHMVMNALLAVAAARALGVTLQVCADALGKVRLSKGRLELKNVGGIDILDDSYNANPDSMVAAVRALAKMPSKGKRIAVLGKMGELGKFSETGHWNVGQIIAEQHIDQLIGVGAEAGIIVRSAKEAGLQQATEVRDVKEAAAIVHRNARPGDLVLIKGSRAAAMEDTLVELSLMYHNDREITART